MAFTKQPVREPRRFWRMIKRVGDCWEWQGSRDDKGYGTMWNGFAYDRVHRFAWYLKFGIIPRGLFVLHRCDNPPCIRPSHLFLGEHQDNMNDMVQKGRLRGADGEVITKRLVAEWAEMDPVKKAGRMARIRAGITSQSIEKMKRSRWTPEARRKQAELIRARSGGGPRSSSA